LASVCCSTSGHSSQKTLEGFLGQVQQRQPPTVRQVAGERPQAAAGRHPGGEGLEGETVKGENGPEGREAWQEAVLHTGGRTHLTAGGRTRPAAGMLPVPQTLQQAQLAPPANKNDKLAEAIKMMAEQLAIIAAMA
jgi:hypothetical protein